MTRQLFVRTSRLAEPVERLLRRVLKNEKLARQKLEEETVHDLRTALRRCRSLAEDFSDFDKHRQWRELRKTCKDHQRGLGELRDAQVLAQLAGQLQLGSGTEGRELCETLDRQEHRGRRTARKSLRDFSRKRWKRWLHALPESAGRIPVGESRLAKVGLKRLEEVRALEKRWRRNRSASAWHQLRVAVKRFRYTVETLLPRQDKQWARKLKRLQDRLGTGHDLDVLRGRIVRLSRQHHFSVQTRKLWLLRVARMRQDEETNYIKEVSLNSRRPLRAAAHSAQHRPRLIWDEWRMELERTAKVSLASAEELAKSAARRA